MLVFFLMQYRFEHLEFNFDVYDGSEGELKLILCHQGGIEGFSYFYLRFFFFHIANQIFMTPPEILNKCPFPVSLKQW